VNKKSQKILRDKGMEYNGNFQDRLCPKNKKTVEGQDYLIGERNDKNANIRQGIQEGIKKHNVENITDEQQRMI